MIADMIRFSDASAIGRTKKTSEGYLVATSRVARTGVQVYRASELGDAARDAGFADDAMVRVYRHEDQVFSKETLNSLTRVPVTLNHPKDMVDADNWGDLAVGEVGDDVLRDGDWIVVNPMIKDSGAREAAATTHREISMGYTANIVKARDGVDADFEQVDIRMNHLALVEKGRAGSQARIGDAATWGASPVTVEDKHMTVELKTVVLGDRAVQVEAKDFDLVQTALKDHKDAIAAKDAEIGKLEVELADAKSKILSDDDLAKMIDEKVTAKAQRAAVVAKLGDKAKDWTDAQIEGAFLAIGDATEVNDDARKAIADRKHVDAESASHAEYVKRLNNGYKGKE